jgi:hypothetical protein
MCRTGALMIRMQTGYRFHKMYKFLKATENILRGLHHFSIQAYDPVFLFLPACGLMLHSMSCGISDNDQENHSGIVHL